MQMPKTLLTLALIGLAASSGVAGRHLAQAPGPSCLTVAETAETVGLSVLLEAVMTAGLADALSSPSALYTVFAPTNEAFVAALPALNLTDPAGLLASPLLGNILKNHLTSSPTASDALIGYGNVTTVLGQPLTIVAELVGNETDVQITSLGGVTASVVTPDVQACESIVHVIDQVLIPEI